MKRALVLSVLIGVLTGCSADTKNGTISGTVTLDGQPLKSGTIRFEPADGQAATANAQITEGKFTATVPVGEKQVSISAPKIVGKRKMIDLPDAPSVDLVEELLPAKYNVKSELTLTVTSGSQSKDYELKSK